ncbi:MAG: hypothetical protein KDE17_14575, partial [Rhodobacteraceae bacterium]|nr:hypothetical protein [Paracoccaceae bacterium]
GRGGAKHPKRKSRKDKYLHLPRSACKNFLLISQNMRVLASAGMLSGTESFSSSAFRQHSQASFCGRFGDKPLASGRLPHQFPSISAKMYRSRQTLATV